MVIAVAVVALALLPSPLIAGLAAFHIARTDRFAVDRDDLLVRTATIAVIAGTAALVMLASSMIWSALPNLAEAIARHGGSLAAAHRGATPHPAGAFAVELFVALVLADLTGRWRSADSRTAGRRDGMASARTLRVCLYLSFTLSPLMGKAIVLVFEHPLATLGVLVVGGLRELAIPVFETIRLAENVIAHPEYELSRAIDFLPATLGNAFLWKPVLIGWLVVVIAADLCGRSLTGVLRMIGAIGPRPPS